MSKIRIEVNGIKYFGFTEISIKCSMISIGRRATLTTTLKNSDLTILPQDYVKIFIDDNQVLDGVVISMDYQGDAYTKTVSYQIDNLILDMAKSSIIKKTFTESDLDSLIRKVLNDNGFSNIKIINKTGGKVLLPVNEQKRPTQNMSVFDFLKDYAQRSQVLLTTDSSNNLIITKESTDVAGTIIRRIGNRPNATNNILSSNMSINIEERFNQIIVYSEQAADIYDNNIIQQGRATDSVIRSTKKKIVNLSVNSINKTLDDLAKWTVNQNTGKAATYNVQLQGYYTDNTQETLWSPNTLIQVLDESVPNGGIDGIFLIKSVEFMKSNTNGSKTSLEIVNRNSFVTNRNQYIDNKNISDLSKNLIRIQE